MNSVFVISEIIKVSVSVISLSLRLRLITLTSTLIIPDITKTSSRPIIVYFTLFNNELTSLKNHLFTFLCTPLPFLAKETHNWMHCKAPH